MILEDVELALEKKDLEWLADLELSVLHVATEAGITEQIGNQRSVDEISASLGIEKRSLEAIIPILKNCGLSVSPPIHPRNTSNVQRLSDLLKGGNAFLKGKADTFSTMWSTGEVDSDSARRFAQIMFEKSLSPATIHCANKPFKDVRSLVDLGGGGGAWAARAVQNHPGLSYTIFDLSTVTKATGKILLREMPDIAEHVSFTDGNFFRDPLPPAQGYLLSNILHDWSPAVCQELLSRLCGQMPSEATLWIHEAILDEDKMGPRFTALFNLLMMLNHGAQQFTLSELTQILKLSGFAEPRVVSRAAHYSLLRCQP